jgi:hypothetical protein
MLSLCLFIKLVIWVNYLADQTQNCNSAILNISSGNLQILLLRQTLDLGTKFTINLGLKKCIFAMANLQNEIA